MMSRCVEEVQYAMRVSSLKGLPRIMSANNPYSRTVWTVGVICFLCICLLTVISNISAYLQYPKVVNVEEKLIRFDDPNGTVPFPSIAICNSNPFSTSKSDLENEHIPLPSDYHERLQNVTACIGCSEKKRKLADYIKRMLMTNRGYYQYAGREAMISMSNPDLILKCLVLIRTGTSYAAYPCERFTVKFAGVHPDFGVCYSYDTSVSKNATIVGYSFMLHLDNSIHNLNTEFEPNFLPQTRSGAIIYIHDPYTIPNALASFTQTAPGMATIIFLKAKRIDRLSKPYSDRECIDAKKYKKVPYRGKLFNYDSMHCLGECTIKYTKDNCNCTDLYLLQTPEWKPPSHEYCASLKRPVDDLFEKMECAERVRRAGFESCAQKCKEPCTEMKYIMRTADSKWPLPSQVPSFYKNVVFANPNLRKQYKQYEQTVNHLLAGYKNISNLDRLLAHRAIDDNFALISVYLGDTYYTHYDSKPKMSLDALISQLGGSFNLWSGITVVVFVEMIDLLLKLIFNPEKDSETDAVSEETGAAAKTDEEEDEYESECAIYA